jgi:hypothetical protein
MAFDYETIKLLFNCQLETSNTTNEEIEEDPF